MLGESVRRAVFWASEVIWGPWTLALMLGTGLFLTVRLRFVQVAHFREALALAFRPRPAEGGGAPLSPFQAFATALAASIGTGNIAGVATAVASGGPGAVFWIWAYGFFAMAVKFTEAVLGVRYRKEGERLSAGPMHYLRDGLGWPRLGWLYALFAGVGALTTTPFSQPNSVAVVVQSRFGVPVLATGIVLAVLTWLVVVGGVRSIGRAAERLAPAKVGLYVLGGLVVLVVFARELPAAFALIFGGAFSSKAAAGGGAGLVVMRAMRYGVARGVYANEAGYGTAAVVYGAARTREPVVQGLNAVIEVAVVSFVTSSITALTLLVTGAWSSGLQSTAAVAAAFERAMPGVGGIVVAVCTFLFGYTTLIGWAYYGEQFLEHLAGPRIVTPYRWLYCGLVVGGAVTRVDTVWAWGDLMNGLQIFPNLAGILGLSGVAAALLREHERKETA